MAGQLKHCAGCRNDYYNHGGKGMDGKGCWSLKDAKVVTRYRIGWWTAPTEPGAFTKVKTNSCHHETGRYGFYETLPSFAVLAKPAKRKAIKLTPVQAAPIDDSEFPF